MKKTLQIVYIAVFLLLCCVPMVLKPFFGGAKAIGNEAENEFPKLMDENGVNRSFSTEADAWFTKQNPLRVPLINAENTLRLSLLHGSSNGVIQGEKGWLFSEETLDDYFGVTLSPRALYSLAKTVRLTQDAAEREGSRFVFTVVPNKNTLYPQYMPARYIKGERSNLSLLRPYLDKLGVHWLDMEQALAGQEKELYLRDDTHWNNLGALYGYNAVMDALDREHESYNGASYTYRRDWTGDLTKMAFPDSGRVCGQYYFDYQIDSVSFKQPRGGDNAALLEELMGDSEKRDGLIRTDNPSGQNSLYMLRDSFGRAMLPYFISRYQSASVSRYYPFAVQAGYDDMVWEIVERNLPTLTETAPRAIAAVIDKEPPPQVCDSPDNSMQTDDSAEGSLKLFGVLDRQMLDTESNIYVQLCSDKQTLCYEAFPVFEQELLGGTDDGNGFSLLLSTQDIPKGSYSAVVFTDGKNAARTQTLQTITI